MTTITESPAPGGEQSSENGSQPNRTDQRGLGYRRNQQLGSSWVLGFVLGAMAIGMVGFVALIVGVAAVSDGTPQVISSTLDLTAREYGYDGNLTVPAGEVTLRLENGGSLSHNIGVRELGVTSGDVGPGGLIELNLGQLGPGTYELFCDIAGHEAAGMVDTLTVVGDAGSVSETASTGGGHGGHDGMDFAAMDAAMMESMLAFPAETEGRGNPILEPTEILADGTKVFDLTAEIVDWEVEPGKFVEAWTYNGVVPAPQFILDRGDKIQVRVVNNLPLGTDIHWHGVHTPNDQDGVAPYTQDLIEPNGGTFTYEFVVDEDAIGMYHAHNHAQMQVVNGMFGVFRVGDNPIPYGQSVQRRDHSGRDLELAIDMPMILNDAGTIGLTLNGKSFPGHRTAGARPGRLGQHHLLQRGAADPPDAPPPVPATRLRQGRHPARGAVLGRHVERRTGRAVHGSVSGRRPRNLGLALPHSHPRRTRRWDVRHGDRNRRQREPGFRSGAQPRRADELAEHRRRADRSHDPR